MHSLHDFVYCCVSQSDARTAVSLRDFEACFHGYPNVYDGIYLFKKILHPGSVPLGWKISDYFLESVAAIHPCTVRCSSFRISFGSVRFGSIRFAFPRNRRSYGALRVVLKKCAKSYCRAPRGKKR